MPRYTLTVEIDRANDSVFEVDATLTNNESTASAKLATKVYVKIDVIALRGIDNDHVAYGKKLSDQFFTNQSIADAWEAARIKAMNSPLQLRLHILDKASELQAIISTLSVPLVGMS